MSIVMLCLGLVLGVVIGYLLGGRNTDELEQMRAELSEAERASTLAEAEARANLASLERERERYKSDLAELRVAFKALSAEALRENNAEFLRQSDERRKALEDKYKTDLAGREAAIKAMLEPLNQQLLTYQERLQQTEGAQATALGEVKNQLATLANTSGLLAKETEQFRRVLHSNQARGRWGEETLRRVVEAAGMSPHCDFLEQAQEGDSKPDLVVRLPGGRQIVVDAKTPDLEFLNELDSAEPAVRNGALASHVARVRSMVTGLAARRYPAAFPESMDYVVLFLPSESLYSVALEADSNLLVWAGQQKVLLATPATLIGLLRAISYSWQQSLQIENGQKILKEAQELYDRVAKFVEHLEAISKGLGQAVNAYNQAVGSYESRVLPSGRRLVDLGLASSKGSLEAVAYVSTTPRPLSLRLSGEVG